MDEITLEQFVEQEKQRLDRFKEYWIKSRETQGTDIFAETMDEIDWYDQYQCYTDRRRLKSTN